MPIGKGFDIAYDLPSSISIYSEISNISYSSRSRSQFNVTVSLPLLVKSTVASSLAVIFKTWPFDKV